MPRGRLYSRKPGWYEAVTYGTLIVILLVKPSGILGKNVGEKV